MNTDNSRFNFVTTGAGRLLASAINASIWLVGIFYLKWDIDQLRVLFMVDMLLYVFFGVLRVIFSQNGENFTQSLLWRVVCGLVVWIFASLLVICFSNTGILDPDAQPFSNDEKQAMLGNLYSYRFTFGLMALNYATFFVHGFIYSGKYKTANFFFEGATDFFSVLVLCLTLTVVLAVFSGGYGPSYLLFVTLGIVFGRFVMEIFLIVITKQWFIKIISS